MDPRDKLATLELSVSYLTLRLGCEPSLLSASVAQVNKALAIV